MSSDLRAFIGAFSQTWSSKVSGGLSVPFTIAALFVPQIWLKAVFALLAVFCFALASFVLWRQEKGRADSAEQKLKPRIEILQHHAATYQLFVTADENAAPINEFHRIAAQNLGLDPVNDARAYVHSMNGQTFPMAPIELHPMHENDPNQRRSVTMFHATPVAWDLLEYRYSADAFMIIGRDYHATFKLFGKVEMEISIAAEGMATYQGKIVVDRTMPGGKLSLSLVGSNS